MSPQTDPTPWLSIVVPLKNEAENLDFVTEAIAAACADLGPYEVIYVDDGSTDATAARVLALRERFPMLRLVQHPTSAGQSAAIHSGVKARPRRGDLHPRRRRPEPARRDPQARRPARGHRASPTAWRWSPASASGARTPPPSAGPRRAANGLRARLLNDGTRDTGCGLKMIRRDVFLGLPYFDHMHRYLPALVARDGWKTLHVDVAHAAAPRRHVELRQPRPGARRHLPTSSA